MSPVLLIIVMVVAVMMVTLFASLSVLRRTISSRTQSAREKFPNAKLIIPNVNFYGQESKGVMQMRGNGTLVLTDSELSSVNFGFR
ncbi:MAG: hypothetical protein ABI690_09050 [Chloroflexota bacterium]